MKTVTPEVPHLSQRGIGAGKYLKDCGPACLAMIANAFGLNVTVDQAGVACKQKPNQYTSIQQLMSGLRAYGIARHYVRPLTIDRIRQELAHDCPIILLIKYNKIPSELKQSQTFTDFHFVVAVGFDDERIYYHDPLFWGDRLDAGAYVGIKDNVLAVAMSEFPPGTNMPRQGLVTGLYVGIDATLTQELEPPPAPSGVTKQGLNIRLGPGTTYAKVREALPGGTLLTIHGKQGVWLKVTALDVDGWVHGGYVTLDEVPEPQRRSLLREELADLCHSQWSGWMRYLFKKGMFNEDGTWTMPTWAVERWKRQTETPYSELSESEQDSDRNEADKFLAVIEAK